MKNYFTSKTTFPGIVIWLLFFIPILASGQALTGTKTIPGTYGSIQAAIADLNANGVGSGGVIFNINAGYTETLTSTLSVTATGTAANQIVFQKNPGTSGANPLIYAYVGTYRDTSTTTADGMWRFIGSDYVTVDGIDLLDTNSTLLIPTLTAVTSMEYGIGFYKKNSSDGANSNTVKNCTVTLNRNNIDVSNGIRYNANGSVGIELVSVNPDELGKTLLITGGAGASSNNKFYNNTIQNCNVGIFMAGYAAPFPYSLADKGNDIGGNSTLTGNRILNFGGGVQATASSTCAAVIIQDQWDFNCSHNIINNNDGNGFRHIGSNRGIWVTASSRGASCNINYNDVTIDAGNFVSVYTQKDYGINCEIQAGGPGNTININNNTLSMTRAVYHYMDLHAIYLSSSATTVNINGNKVVKFAYYGSNNSACIWATSASGSSGGPIGTLNINDNSLNGVVLTTQPGNTYYKGGTHYNIYVYGNISLALNIKNDSTNSVVLDSTVSRVFKCIYTETQSSNGAVHNISNNVFQNISWTNHTVFPSGEFGLFYFLGNTKSVLIDNNKLIGNLSIPTSGTCYLMSFGTGGGLASPTVVISNNRLTGTGINRTSTFGSLYGFWQNYGDASVYYSGNVWSNMTVADASNLYASYHGGTGAGYYSVKNNTISNLMARTGILEGIHLANMGYISECTNNSVTNIVGYGKTSGIAVESDNYSLVTLNLFKNIISGIATRGNNIASGIAQNAQNLSIDVSNIYQNRIFDITADTSGASAFGINIAGGITTNIYNNLVGDLKAPAVNAPLNLVGINLTGGTTNRLFHNTINLDVSSSGANFGSSCVYAATTSNLVMSNNVLINNSVPNGTGLTSALRRNGSGLSLYDTTSNNNLLFAGNLAGSVSSRYLYYDGTNGDSLLADFKARVTPREGLSATENVTFQSTMGSDPNFLNPDLIYVTAIESGASPITPPIDIATDISGNIRYKRAGYTGAGAAPDMGAFEGNYQGLSMVYDSSNTDQVMALVYTNSANQPVIRMRVHVEKALNPLSVTRFRLNTAGTTASLVNISNARVFYTGDTNVFVPRNQFGSVVVAPNGSFVITGNQQLKAGVNYFWLTYDINSFASGADVLDARCDSIMVAGINRIPITNVPNGTTPINDPPVAGGVYTIGSAPYYTLGAAVADLTRRGIADSVILKVPSGWVEQAPVGGYILGSKLLNNTISSTKRIAILKNGIGPNPILYANVGTSNVTDGIFQLLGVDYVTINGIDLIDTNTINNIVKMERGFTLFKLNKVAPFDGCQYNSIINCSVKLNRTNPNSKGIYADNIVYDDLSNTTLVITQSSDENSHNTIVYNTIENVSSGIYFSGYDLRPDQFNKIIGNTVFNFDGSNNTSYGIYMRSQLNDSITDNNIDNYRNGVGGTIGSSSEMYGIQKGGAYQFVGNYSPATFPNSVISNNIVHLTIDASTQDYSALRNISVSSVPGNITINNNSIKWQTIDSVVIHFLVGISVSPPSANAGTIRIKNNRIDSVTIKGDAYGIAIQTSGTAPVFDIGNNAVTHFTRKGGMGDGGLYAFLLQNNDNYRNIGTITSFYNNVLDSINNGPCAIYGMMLAGGYTMNIYNNQINKLYTTNAGDIWGLYHTDAFNSNVYNNTVSTLNGGGNVYAIYDESSYVFDQTIHNNRIFNISASGTNSSYGIYLASAGLNSCKVHRNMISGIYAKGSGNVRAHGVYIAGASSTAPASMNIGLYNNLISDLRAPNSSALPSIAGINFDQTSNKYKGFAYNNTIYLADTVGIVDSVINISTSSACIYISNLTPTVALANNILVNKTLYYGTGFATAIYRNGSSLTTYDMNSNNNLMYAGPPSSNNLIYFNGSGKDSTLDDFKKRVAPLEGNSVTEDPVFIGTSISLPNFLLPDTNMVTAIESGAKIINGITDTDVLGNIRQGNPSYSGTGSAPDMGAYEKNYVYGDLLAPDIRYQTLSNTYLLTDRIISVTISDKTGVANSTNKPTLYYRKNSGVYQMSAGTLTSGSLQNGIWAFTISSSALGGVVLGDTIAYFIAAQDISVNNNFASSPLGAKGTVSGIVNYPVPNYYRIVNGITGSYSVGLGGTFWNLTNPGGAFDVINNSTLFGDVTLTVVGDLNESGLIALKKWNEEGGSYSVKIVPDAAVERQIVDTAATNAPNSSIITFDGTANATVDGRFNGSGRYLRFRNSGANGIAFYFINDAVHNTIRYTSMECATTTSGTIVFGGSSLSPALGGRGNDSNTIVYNNIGDVSSSLVAPSSGIVSQGTSGLENDGNMILYNNIYNFTLNAITLNTIGTGNNWLISNNQIYRTSSKGTGDQYVINIRGGGGHIVRKNSIGGAAPGRSGDPMYTSANNFYGIYISSIESAATIIDSNSIANISCNNMYGIYAAAHAQINNNIIGGGQSPWDSITLFSGAYLFSGIYAKGQFNVSVRSNEVSHLRFTGLMRINEDVKIYGIYVGTYGLSMNTYSDNKIHDFLGSLSYGSINNTNKNNVSFLMTGFYLENNGLSSTVVMDNNAVYDLVNTSSAPVFGAVLATCYSPLNFTRNKIYNISSKFGAVAGIFMPIRTGGTNAPFNFKNNLVSLPNPTSSDMAIGIFLVNSFQLTNYKWFNNSVFIGGTGDPTSVTSSYACYRTGTGNSALTDIIDMRNNILYNSRTGGSGNHCAIGYQDAGGITPSTFNYNLLVAADTSKIAELPGITPTGIGAFNSRFPGTYASNWMASSTDIPAQTLFSGIMNGDLSIVTTNANCWYANGKGIAIADVPTDVAGNARSTTITGGATDIGAFEFSTATTPPSATATTSPALNATTSYIFGGKTVAAINWGNTGTLPSAVDVKYYTGTNAASLLPGKTQFNSYYTIAPAGGSGYTYNLSLSYDSAMLGTVSGTSSAKMVRYNSFWSLLPASSADGVSGMLSSGLYMSGATLSGDFTGTDFLNNPLPVDLITFTAYRMKNDVLVIWTTASENNSHMFEIERSVNGKDFDRIGSVSAKGNSTKTASYQFNDKDIVSAIQSDVIYYRLKTIDNNGSFDYSKVAVINLAKDIVKASMTAYPNPFSHLVSVSLMAEKAGKANCIIVDITGKNVYSYSQTVSPGDNQIQMDASSLNTGLYFLSIELNGEKHIIKLIKQ